MIDHRAFLTDHFNDPHGVIGLVGKHLPDADLKLAAVKKWFERGSIPGEWLGPLVVIAERERGRGGVLEEYWIVNKDIFA